MGDKTGISWTDATWNPVRGCSRVSEGCRHCYAERVAARFSGPGQPYEGLATLRRAKRITGPTGELTTPVPSRSSWTGVVRLISEHLADPLRWRKPRRIFVNSMSDLFHESLTNEQIASVFGVMAACPRHTFQVLTKRPKRMREWFAWVGGLVDKIACCMDDVLERSGMPQVERARIDALIGRGPRAPAWPLPNVHLGVSVENQTAADERIPDLLATPAAVRFLSCEPLIAPVDAKLIGCFHEGAGTPERPDELEDHSECAPRIHWLIAGCESGPGARPCDVAWLRSLRDQCADTGVAFWLKQAHHRDGEYMIHERRPLPDVPGRIGELVPVVALGPGSKRKAGDIIELPYLDGVQHAAMPEVAR